MKTSKHLPLKFIPALPLVLVSLCAHAQEKPADTVIVPLAETSKIIFTIGDRDDLDVLKHYNFQELFMDILRKLEETEGVANTTVDSTRGTEETEENRELASEKTDEAREEREDEFDDDENYEDEDFYDDDDDDNKWDKSRGGRVGQTWQSYNIDLGTNNYLDGGQFPDGGEQYAVRPWGSWYIAGNSVQRTRLGKNFFVEWGLGISWYTFKFEEDNTLILKDDSGVHFTADNRDVDYVKSKLGATFINVSLVPVLDFGDHSRRHRIWEGDRDGFRFGIGPYAGYRIGSKTKLVYETDGDRHKEKDHDNFYLNNLRYGLRLQIGVRATDLFLNYDLNDLFADGKGPKLSAISFGFIF